VGQPGCGCRLPQPGQLTIGEELLGYHNNNSGVRRCLATLLIVLLQGVLFVSVCLSACLYLSLPLSVCMVDHFSW